MNKKLIFGWLRFLPRGQNGPRKLRQNQSANNINVSLWGGWKTRSQEEEWQRKKEETARIEGCLKDQSRCPPRSNGCHVLEGERGHAPVSGSVSSTFFCNQTQSKKNKHLKRVKVSLQSATDMMRATSNIHATPAIGTDHKRHTTFQCCWGHLSLRSANATCGDGSKTRGKKKKKPLRELLWSNLCFHKGLKGILRLQYRRELALIHQILPN